MGVLGLDASSSFSSTGALSDSPGVIGVIAPEGVSSTPCTLPGIVAFPNAENCEIACQCTCMSVGMGVGVVCARRYVCVHMRMRAHVLLMHVVLCGWVCATVVRMHVWICVDVCGCMCGRMSGRMCGCMFDTWHFSLAALSRLLVCLPKDCTEETN